MPKYDKRRKYYLVLDCETATLPCASNYTEEQRKSVAIAKPLIYDLGWQVVDKNGTVYHKVNYLITEIFSVPQIFNTAYYAEKRPIYLEKIKNGEITLVNWETAITDLLADLDVCEAVGAYNSMFDFKKAIPFTELYISKVYSADYQNWLNWQEKSAEWIATHKPNRESDGSFEECVFRFRGKAYPLFCLWGLSCKHLLNCVEYKQMCVDNEWNTASGKYFKTSAETAYRFLSKDTDFVESHTALDDVIIETLLFAEIVKRTKGKWELGITHFPFRELGTTEDYENLGNFFRNNP